VAAGSSNQVAENRQAVAGQEVRGLRAAQQQWALVVAVVAVVRMVSLVPVTAMLQEQQQQQLAARVGVAIASAAAMALAGAAAQQQQQVAVAAVAPMALALALVQQGALQPGLALALAMVVAAQAAVVVVVVVRLALGLRQVAEHQDMVQQQLVATLVGRLWCVSGTLEAWGALQHTCQTRRCVHRLQVGGRPGTCMCICRVHQLQHVDMHMLSCSCRHCGCGVS
jgi:hypothetical protein